jgi:hypothetical protein
MWGHGQLRKTISSGLVDSKLVAMNIGYHDLRFVHTRRNCLELVTWWFGLHVKFEQRADRGFVRSGALLRRARIGM